MIDVSVHEGTECTECHEDISELPHAEKLDPVNCGNCHEDVTALYKKHGILEVGTDADLPSCASCHGTHDILSPSDRRSKVHPLKLPETCGGCHENIVVTKANLSKEGDAKLPAR